MLDKLPSGVSVNEFNIKGSKIYIKQGVFKKRKKIYILIG